MWEIFKSAFRHDSADSFNSWLAKIIAGWAAVFAGISLGDLATLAALIYTLLNITFLLYDRFIKPRRSGKKGQ